jgi:hypothetical protein
LPSSVYPFLGSNARSAIALRLTHVWRTQSGWERSNRVRDLSGDPRLDASPQIRWKWGSTGPARPGHSAEARQPLGLAMVGGLLVSQLLTLYLTPVIYVYLDRLSHWRPFRRGDAITVPAE